MVKSKSRRKGKKRKDSNKPKRAMSSFMFFANEKRQGLRLEHPELKITEIGKELGRLWKDLADEEKKRYIEQATQDKARYHHAMSTYVKSVSDSDSDDGPRRKRRKKKKVKDPLKPKRAMSSFMYFANEQRQAVRDKYPDIKITEIGKRLSEMWKLLTAEEKQRYIDLADKDKARYNSEMEHFKNKKTDVVANAMVIPGLPTVGVPGLAPPSNQSEESDEESSEEESSSEGEA